MKKKTNEKSVLKQETKNDIQELFNELFVRELNEKISNVSEQNSEKIEEVEKKINNLTNDYSIIRDEILSLTDVVKCIGTYDEWGGETLVNFLNILSQNIGDCKKVVDDQTKYLGYNGGLTLIDSLADLKKEINDLKLLIQDLEKQILKKLNCLDDVTKSLEQVKNELQVIKLEFRDEALSKKIMDSQQLIFDEISLKKESIEKVGTNISSINSYIDLISNILSKDIESMKSDIVTMNGAILTNKTNIQKKMDEMVVTGKQKLIYTVFGMGALIILNIVMLVMLLIK